jgi:U4/U6.U5 tri-snRNP-associated protein 1
MEGANELSMSVEDTNKLRASLGLPLLEEENTNDKAIDNFASHVNKIKNISKREGLANKIQKEKNLNSRAKMVGESLGEDVGIDDTLTWIKSMKTTKKPEKIIKNKMEEYTSSDLAGMKVVHDLGDMLEGGDMILTLKDATIEQLDKDGDELENFNLAELDRKKRNILESKGRAYNAYDDDHLTKKSILSHYDELDAQIGFQIESKGAINALDLLKKKQNVQQGLLKASITLDSKDPILNSDYYTTEEISIRKPKRKNRKIRKQDDINLEPINIPLNPSKFSNSNFNTDITSINFVDDDDLQNSLSRARKHRVKPKVLLAVSSSSDDEDYKGMIISDTSEFVKSLEKTSLIVRQLEKSKEVQIDSDEMEVDVDVGVDVENEVGEYDQMAKEDENEGDIKEKIVEEEPLVSSGLMATLSLLAKQGVIAPPKQSTLDTEKGFITLTFSAQLGRFKWQASQKKQQVQSGIDADYKRQRNKEKGELGKRRYEESNNRKDPRLEERLAIQAVEDKFKDYIPDVKLEYKDDAGRHLTPKEVFIINC